jgi:hypothetical protein
MATRLQPLSLHDFTGGLNVRDNSFQLGDNESPAMLNVHVDSRVGFATREGWARWTPTDDATLTTWDPRNAHLHQYSDGSFAVYVTNANTVLRTDPSGAFVDTGMGCFAAPHLADFAAWGDDLYIVSGATHPSWKRDETTATALNVAGNGTWNDDYTTPGLAVAMPSAELIETHSSYLFVANVSEDYDGDGAARYPNRLRWSHPSSPGDWAQLDFLDIGLGGSRIRALRSFDDHLLIFKDSTVWALYGYDSDSWQLVQVSSNSGSVSPTTVTASESQCFYYSPTGRGAIYAIESGNRPVSISEPIRQVVSETMAVNNVWLSWIASRLLCSLPWEFTDIVPVEPAVDARHGRTGSNPTSTTTFTFDPSIGEGGGAWEAHKPAFGHLRSAVELPGDKAPLVVHAGDATARCLLRIAALHSDATDIIHASGIPTPFEVFYATNWKDAGSEELRKSWRRPRFILNNPEEDIQLRLDAYRDYDSGTPYRSWTFGVDAFGRTFWRDLGAAAPEGDGFDWDDGTLWEGDTSGSRIIRGGPLGIARSIQLRITPTPAYLGRAWGVDAITLKYIQRRFTT